jgi:hypothetical protein
MNPEDPVSSDVQMPDASASPAQTNIGAPSNRESQPTLPIVMVVLIWLMALGTLGFNTSCQSDGCIGVFFLAAIMWGITAVQLFIALPVSFGSRSGRSSEIRRPMILAALSLLPAVTVLVIVIWQPT